MNIKNQLLPIIFMLIWVNITAQCPPGNVTLITQSEVNDFGTMYPNCTEINGYLRIGQYNTPSDINDLTSLGQINTVVNEVRIQSCDLLTDLSDLSNLTTIGRYLSIHYNDALTHLTGLNNVETVGGISIYDNDALVDLSINHNDALTSMTGLENLTTISGLSISENDALISLTGLENLVAIASPNAWVNITNNDALVSLSGMQDAVCPSIDSLDIYGNPQLEICNTTCVCDHITYDGGTRIYNNAFGCLAPVQIIAACPNTKIQGEVFYDINQNGSRDTDEPINTSIPINVEPEGITTFTNPEYGSLTFVEPGNYTVSYDKSSTSDWELTTDSSSYFFNLEEGDCGTAVFGVYPTILVSELQNFISSPATRCNEEILFRVNTKNMGTTIADGILWLEIDENTTITDFFYRTPDTTATNLYGWFFEDLYPSEVFERNILLQIPGPPDFPLGDSLTFHTYTDFEDANGGQSSQHFTYQAEVRCSYDPNDKLVNPSRTGGYTLFGEDLVYTIRFQNTGNDFAYDVVVRDTLDNNLDWESFRVLGSSHSDKLSTSVTREGTVTFEFKGIMLPDSTTNPTWRSQGYITYMINHLDGLAENTSITNSAGIYFDLNPPIITNQTKNILVSQLPTVSTHLPNEVTYFILFPNPVNSELHLQLDIPKTEIEVNITSITGEIIHREVVDLSGGVSFVTFDTATYPPGVYFLSVNDGKEIQTQRFVKS